jgi:hypothetical protein
MAFSFQVYFQLTWKTKPSFLLRYQGVIVKVGRYPDMIRKENVPILHFHISLALPNIRNTLDL